MRTYELVAGSTDLTSLRLVEHSVPKVSGSELLIRVRAASLNSRDQAIVAGKYFGKAIARDLIPLSDGAGEVVDAGPDVTLFRCGDRVVGTFFQNWNDGPPPGNHAALGNPLDGTLTEYMVLPEDGVLGIPDNLSFEEASTLPCAAVTAWNSLFCAGKPVCAGDTVLCLGTGGVSIAAVMFAKWAAARVIVTSSCDHKIQTACEFGADEGLNYLRCPEWGKELANCGINHVIEVGGAGTLRKSLQALAPGGKIAFIGALTGLTGNLNWGEVMSKNASLHGVSVGSKRMFEELSHTIAAHNLHPLIDRVFPFDCAAEAFRYHANQNFVGKVVITV